MSKLTGRRAAIVFAVLCGTIVCSRLHTYREPLERDLTTYAVIAHEMLGGKALYRELWDHKPPAIHVTYAAAELIAGYGRNSIFLMNVASAVLTMLACYWAGSAVGGRVPGCFAAALWGLTSGNLALEGNQPNTEVFINVCLAFAFALFIRPGKPKVQIGRAIAIGLLFATASLYKHIVAVDAVLLVIAYLFCSWPDRRKTAFTECAIVGVTGCVTWALVFAFFYSRGSGQAFVEAVFGYNRYYASHGWTLNVIQAQGWPSISPETFTVMLPLTVLTAFGIVHGLASASRKRWILLTAYLLASGTASVMPGWFFPHYFQLLLPPLAIGAGWTSASLYQLLPVRFGWLSYTAGASACAIVTLLQVPDYLVPADEWSIRKYGPIFVSTEQMAKHIQAWLRPDQTFYEWGEECGLYFSTKREPPTGLLFSYPMVGGLLADKLSHRLLEDLNRAKPELVLVSKVTLTATTPNHPVVEWLQLNYRLFADSPAFFLFSRKQSDFDIAIARQAVDGKLRVGQIKVAN